TVRITDPDAFLDTLAEGGSGYHFLGRSAQKVVLVHRSAVGAAA
ncbi:MAG: Fis family transcriptional regulator, partial [Alphaproteobacteria bacterium]|nr:Fis family transcriptional regulator [Alphaproteobacteria bacterium]